jgi:hypothetical protein
VLEVVGDDLREREKVLGMKGETGERHFKATTDYQWSLAPGSIPSQLLLLVLLVILLFDIFDISKRAPS